MAGLFLITRIKGSAFQSDVDSRFWQTLMILLHIIFEKINAKIWYFLTRNRITLSSRPFPIIATDNLTHPRLSPFLTY